MIDRAVSLIAVRDSGKKEVWDWMSVVRNARRPIINALAGADRTAVFETQFGQYAVAEVDHPLPKEVVRQSFAQRIAWPELSEIGGTLNRHIVVGSISKPSHTGEAIDMVCDVLEIAHSLCMLPGVSGAGLLSSSVFMSVDDFRAQMQRVACPAELAVSCDWFPPNLKAQTIVAKTVGLNALGLAELVYETSAATAQDAYDLLMNTVTYVIDRRAGFTDGDTLETAGGLLRVVPRMMADGVFEHVLERDH